MKKGLSLPLFLLIPVLLLCSVLLSTEARAFDVTTADAEVLEERARSLDGAIAEAMRTDLSLEAARLGLEPSQIAERRERLEALQALYFRLSTALSRTERLQKETQAIEETASSGGRAFQQEPPYPLSFLDEQKEYLQGLQQQLDALRRSRALAQRALERAKTGLSDAEAFRRRLADGVRGGEPSPGLAWRISLADLAISQSRAETFLQEKLMANAALSEKKLAIEIELARQNRDWVAKNLVYNEEDLQARLKAEENRKADLSRRVEEGIRLRERLEKELTQAQAVVQKAQTEDQALVASAQLQTKTLQLGYAQSDLELLQGRIDLASKAQQIWRARYAMLKGGLPSSELFSFQNSAAAWSEELDKSLSALQAYQTTLSSNRESLNRDLAAANLLPKVVESLKAREKDLSAAIENNLAALSDVLRLSTLNDRLIEETKQTIGAVQLAEKVTSMGRRRVVEVWQTELWTSGDHGVTVGKLLIALVLMVIGSVASRRTAQYVGDKLLTRFEMELGAAQAAKNFSFYMLILLFFLAALRVVNIPLTAFAFLGGAFAIGIGLGAQKFFSDLISGFVILMQKPFRINDMIQVDGMFATVVEVGSRYTKIRTFDNADVMMPNGYLLDNRIINWTLGDRIMRSKVTVGAGYDSDPKRVRELLLRAASEHLKVLPKPTPFVVFSDFGDSALVFDLYFWVHMDFASGLVVGSDLRYRIIELFRQEGISIAFPQSDVHLDVVGPLRVRLEGESGTGPDARD